MQTYLHICWTKYHTTRVLIINLPHRSFYFRFENLFLCQSIEINNNKHVYRQSQVRKPTCNGVERAECTLIMGTGCRVQVLACSSIAQLVCQRRFGVCDTGFESCIQQRKTTCLLSIRKSLVCDRASKLTTINMYIARAICESKPVEGSSGLIARWSQGWDVE